MRALTINRQDDEVAVGGQGANSRMLEARQL